MKQLTREWVEKAEADFESARRELRRRTAPNLDLACFLAQQSIEKYLKARLQEARIQFGRTHDLESLANLLGKLEPQITAMKSTLKRLSAYAVVFRYPGSNATLAEARDAQKCAREVRQLVRMGFLLGLAAPRTKARSKSTRKTKKVKRP